MTKPALLSMIFAAACVAAPATPTWQGDVLPVIASNCAKCHGYPAEFGAPAGFRLDVLEDGPTIDPTTGWYVHGAQTMYLRIKERVADGSMPPLLPLTGADADILSNWAAEATDGNKVQDTFTTPPPRTGRPGDRAPTIALGPGGTADTLAYAIDDPDHDLVEGTLSIGGVVIAEHLRAGRGTVPVDLSLVTAGAHVIDALLDDGSAPAPTTASTGVAIDVPGDPATPPTSITFEYPPPLDLVTQTDPTQIGLCATTNGVTAAISLVDPHGVHAEVALDPAFGIAHCNPGTEPTVPWQTFKDALTDPISDWQIKVVVGAQTILSPKFRVLHGALTGHFADVQAIFQNACASSCHHNCGAYPASLPYDFDNYGATDGCGHSFGVGDRDLVKSDVPRSVPGLIYDHVVVREDMPPPQTGGLDDADRAAIKAWLLGGAQP